VTLGAGAIAGPDIVAMLGQASQRILTGWSLDTPSRTAFSSLAVDVTMADGIATLGAAALDAPGLKVSVTGDIDFLRRAVDLRADPKLIAADRDVSGLPVKIVVNGPWGAPRIYPDVPGLLLNPQKGFETLKSMGLASGN
jgi:AsmA protein